MQAFIAINQVHQAEHQGYTIAKQGLKFQDQEYKYTEDTGRIFEVMWAERKLMVSSVCDGHAGYQTSFLITSIIEKMFNDAISDTEGDVDQALSLLFIKLANEVSKMRSLVGDSGATCNVTVFDPTNARVHVASLGDSPTLKYNKDDQNRHFLDWRSNDQDCADEEEIERMIQIHKQNGELNATKNSVVFEIITKCGEETGVWRNRRTQMMLMSSFGDFCRDYYTGMVNTVPRISSHVWRPSDVWIQCSDGLLEWLSPERRSIQPQSKFRVEEIARHLDICVGDANIAQRLHELQITSMVEAKSEAHPLENVTREWVEKNFDNHFTKVFTTTSD